MIEKLETATRVVDQLGSAAKKLVVAIVLALVGLVGAVKYGREQLSLCALGLGECQQTAAAGQLALPVKEPRVPTPTPSLARCDLSGIVTDSVGAPLASAVIEVSPIGRRKRTWYDATGATGEFCAPPLAAGRYRVVVRKSGFGDTEQDIQISAGISYHLSIILVRQRLFP